MAIARIRFVPALALLAVSAAPGLLFGAPEDYVGKRIVAIQYVPPEQPMLASELAEIMPLRVDDTLRLPELRAAIDRLWATGRYSEIAVDAVPTAEGVVLRFITEPNWFISGIEVLGVIQPPNRGQLENATKLELGSRYSQEKVQEAVENLNSLLRQNGFHEASIRYSFERKPAGQEIDITFRVDPGPRASFSVPLITGDPQRKPEEVISMTGWERFWLLPGYKDATQARMRQGLEKIRKSYVKDRRLMASARLDNQEYDPASTTVTPVVEVRAGPKVEITTSGARISKGRLRDLVPVYQEQAVDRDLLNEGAKNIADYLQSDGYFRAKVHFERESPEAGPERIVYHIDRGPRFKVARVSLEGNRYFDEETLRERMYIREASLLRYRYGRYSEEYLKEDIEAITNLYRTNGFRNVEVSADVDENYQGKPLQVAVTVKIAEGPQWLVGNLDVQGLSAENREHVAGILQSTEGQPFSEFNVATDRDNVLNYFFNSGYPDAQFESFSQESAAPNRVQLRYTISEGRRQFVRDVLIGGLDKTERDLVFNRISLRKGDPLSLNEMIESQNRLYDLGIFARVATAVQNADGLAENKFVLYQFEEARKYSFQVGGGAQIARIGTGSVNLDSPVGGPGFSPRLSLGVTRFNFKGLGHSLGLQTMFSNLQQRALFTYLAPQFYGNENINLTFSALYDDSRNVRTFTARRREGSVQFGQRIALARSLQYRFTYRRVSVSDLRINPLLVPRLSQPVRIGLASIGFVQDRRNDFVDPTRGNYNTLDIGVASKIFASQSDFFRLLGRNATYHPLSRNVTFARQLTFGWINNLGSDEIPLPERFFAGGATSDRAFPDNQAGPRDLVTGFPIGGNALMLFQHELRFPLLGDNIGGVLFHDFGNVYSDLGAVSFRVKQRNLSDFNYNVNAVGFGLRYRTPIGPIRVDLGYTLNPPSFLGFKGDRDQLLFCGTPNPPPNINCAGTFNVRQTMNRFQFHFSLGQTF